MEECERCQDQPESLLLFDPAAVKLENIQECRTKMRSREYSAYALEGVMLALRKHVTHLNVLEDHYIHLQEKYGRKKPVNVLRRVVATRKKLRERIHAERRQVQFFRGVLIEQIQATEGFGHEQLSEEYAEQMLQLSTPFELEKGSDAMLIKFNRTTQQILHIWKMVRAEIDALLQQSHTVLTALEKTIADVHASDGSIIVATC